MNTEKIEHPGKDKASIARKFGQMLRERMEKDAHFYLFSPDETTSNKLDEVYEATERAWGLAKEDWDLPESCKGRVVELLSENALFSAMVGHVMNGEQAMMTSYEAFFSIIFSQVVQQIKFYKQCDETDWRPKYPAINLLSTSTCWRQDHNGYTHQSPAMISALLAIPSGRVNCLFPVDDVSAEECFRYMITSENVVNLTTFDKNEMPRWIDKYHAKFLFDNGGASIFRFASDENPDVVLTAAGDIVTRETLLGMEMFRGDYPTAKLRFVGVVGLTHNAIGTHDHRFTKDQFYEYFGREGAIIANFHGYKDTFRNILGQYTRLDRITALGYCEEGSTTTPLEMLTMNHASRWDVAIEIAKVYGRGDLVEKYQNMIAENHKYALANGVDLG